MKSIYWIDKAKTANGVESDYKIAQMLGMTRGGISHHRRGKVETLDDETAFKIEELCGIPHGKVMADQQAERAKNPAVRAAWQKLAAIACQLLIVAGLAFTFAPNPANAKEILLNQALDTRYIMRTLADRPGAGLHRMIEFN